MNVLNMATRCKTLNAWQVPSPPTSLSSKQPIEKAGLAEMRESFKNDSSTAQSLKK